MMIGFCTICRQPNCVCRSQINNIPSTWSWPATNNIPTTWPGAISEQRIREIVREEIKLTSIFGIPEFEEVAVGEYQPKKAEQKIEITKKDLSKAIEAAFRPSASWGDSALRRLAKELGFKDEA